MYSLLPLVASPSWSLEPCAELEGGAGLSSLSLILPTLHLTLFSDWTVVFPLILRILVQTSVALKGPIPQPMGMFGRK